MLSKLQFLAALCVGASYRLWTLVRASWSEARGIWVALRSDHQYVSDEIKVRRLAVCRKCPIFYAPLQTCGSPLRKDASEGCHCYIPIMAGTYHDCWAFENTYVAPGNWAPSGWPSELNSSVIDKV